MQTVDSKRNKTIDSIKGLLILFVIFGHINIDIKTRRLLLAPFWENSAVPMFMLISGYLYTKSYKKNNISTLKEAYSIRLLLKKMLRFFVPYTLFFIFEVLFYVIAGSPFVTNFIKLKLSTQFPSENYVPKINSLLLMFIRGGEGPGSYYVPLMFEFILIFPLVYFLIKKEKKKGIIICALITTLYDLVYTYLGVHFHASINNIFYCLFVISIGIYAALFEIDYKNKLIYVGMIMGIVYILLVKYFDYTPLIYNASSSRGLPACLFWYPIITYLISNNTFYNRFLSYLGKMSFDILLVQKVFFIFLNVAVYYFVDNTFLQSIIIFSIIIIASIIFNHFEKAITKHII